MTDITGDDLRPLLPGLMRYARLLCRGFSGDAAEDLLQATLERAVTKQHHFDGTNLKGWLGTLMHNEHVNRVRHATAPMRAGVHVPLDHALSMRAEGTSTGLDRLALRDIGRALGRLHPEQRETITLVAVEGMTYQEAADLMDVPVGTVRSRLSRGRDALRRAA